MITANLHITEGPVSREVRVRAASLARAMQIAGGSRPGVSVEPTGAFRLISIPATDAAPAGDSRRAA